MKISCILCICLLKTMVTGRQNLYVGGLFELTKNWYWRYANFFVTMIEHVFEEVDNRTDILTDYSLKLVAKDTEGESGLSTRQMVEMMTEETPKIAILGPTFSDEMTVVGQITPFYDVIHENNCITNFKFLTPPPLDHLAHSLVEYKWPHTFIGNSEFLTDCERFVNGHVDGDVGDDSLHMYFVQLSYIASTSSTVDRHLYRTLFKVNQIMDDLNPLRIKMMQSLNWERVGTIVYQDDINVSTMTIFHELLQQNNLTLVTSVVFSDNADFTELITRLAHHDVRIIMGSFRGGFGPAIFCEAYKQGLFGHNHVWILGGPTIHSSWIANANVEGKGCTREQFLEATNGCFTLKYARLSPSNNKGISDKTGTEVKAILDEKLVNSTYKLSSSFGWVYDSAWALAIGLNNTLQYLNESGFVDYTNNPYYLSAIMKGMSEVNFAGISGPVAFDDEGSRMGLTYIEQNFGGNRTSVAVYNPWTKNLTWFVPIKSLWAGGNIPEDRFTYHFLAVQPNIPSLVMIQLANVLCCLVALGFLGFNTYYRTNSNIKLSSPMINNLIIVGSLLMYVGVFFSAFDYGNLDSEMFRKNICMIRIWIMSLGFTTLFGALFSKTWRVHILFRDYKLKKTSIRDYHLFGMVFFLLLIDCIILVPWTLTHRLQKKSVSRNLQDLYNYNNVISEVYTYCYHPYEGYWFLSLYIYKGLLLVFGTFLAWETRQVTVPALNDSKYIGFCIYNVVIVCIFGVPLAHVLPTEQTTLNFVLLSALVMFCTTMCLCILFLPKLKFRNKVSERFLVPSLNTLASASDSLNKSAKQESVTDVAKTTDKESSEDCLTFEELKNENNRLRMQIAAETIALARLKRDILHMTGNVQFYRAGDQYVVFQSKVVSKGDGIALNKDIKKTGEFSV